jgi:hypothetical protein
MKLMADDVIFLHPTKTVMPLRASRSAGFGNQ